MNKKGIKKINKALIFFWAPIFLVSLLIYLQYFNKINFGDEYDNFVFSWLFRSGQLPYRDFFTHHFPTLIFLGLPLEFLSHTKEIYRFFVLLCTFSLFTFMMIYFKGKWSLVAGLFTLISAFGISQYSGQQFADGTFWALWLMAGLAVVIKKDGERFNRQETFLLTALSFLTFLSSPMHLLGFVMLIAFHLLLVSRHNGELRVEMKTFLLKFIFYFLGLIFLFGVYLFATKSVDSFIRDAILFNRDIFYLNVYTPYIDNRFIDFYLHTSRDVFNHFYELIIYQGHALVVFIRSAKFLLFPIGFQGNYLHYAHIVFTDLYNNFLSFEMLIALFVLSGIVALLTKRRFALAIFCIIFIFSLRLRLSARIHMAPYYLFSFFMISTAIVFFLDNIRQGREKVLNAFAVFTSIVLVLLFVNKSFYQFNQIAYNSFPKKDAGVIEYIGKLETKRGGMLAISSEASTYHYDSNIKPSGYFVGYFPWFQKSPELRKRWLNDIENYHGSFLVVPKEPWKAYKQDRPTDVWLNETFEEVSKYFSRYGPEFNDDLLFRRNQ